MIFKNVDIPGVFEITPINHHDHRGSLIRNFDSHIFNKRGHKIEWAQQIHSYTEKKNTIRGLHVQMAPEPECKLISVFQGQLFWVYVDLRTNSKTFGEWGSIILHSGSPQCLLVPPQFAHGCLSLTDNVHAIILADNHYYEALGYGILWKDEELAIDWPLNHRCPLIISDEHNRYASFNKFRKSILL